MNVFITGISGLIGTALAHHFNERGATIYGLSRNPESAMIKLPASVTLFKSLPENIPCKLDVIINLQGEGIADKRWTAARKKVLYDSRVEFTHRLEKWVNALPYRVQHFISASAVGYYGRQDDNDVIESTEPHDEFTHQLCSDWEAAALKVENTQHHTIVRLGVVLSHKGGFLKKLYLPFLCLMGGKLGDGEQYLSWIHIRDVVEAIDYVITQNIDGVYNLVSPNPVTNATFTRAYAQHLNRPAFMHMPEAMIKLIFGEMSDILLTGQRALPENLLYAGYTFSYPYINTALDAKEARR